MTRTQGIYLFNSQRNIFVTHSLYVTVTTRVTQQQTVKKPMSPFAKFRQMDRQNSLNTPPR